MKVYHLCIKNHIGTPIYEDWLLAKNKKEAARAFEKRMNKRSQNNIGIWYWENLLKYIKKA